MKNTGSILSLIGGAMVIIIALASLLVGELKDVWQYEFSAEPGFVIVAVILAIMITILAFLSFSAKPRLMGLIILAASFAGIIVGSTLTDIAMLLCVCGGILLFTLPPQKTEKKITRPGTQTPNPPNPS
jgi:MFS family permease